MWWLYKTGKAAYARHSTTADASPDRNGKPGEGLCAAVVPDLKCMAGYYSQALYESQMLQKIYINAACIIVKNYNERMTKTDTQYDAAVAACKDIFIKKTIDYGTSWRVLRTISVVDQIFIKALRIRTIQEVKEQKVSDDIKGEFKGILNYAIIGLVQLQQPSAIEDLPVDVATSLYSAQAQVAKQTMLAKNHDYGEAWRDMTQQSFTDLILVKLLRIKQILQNDGKTLISEGIDANYIDIINYAAFALILIEEGKHVG